MTLNDFNLGQLLHLLNNDEHENKLRLLEKQQKQILAAKCLITFYHIYIHSKYVAKTTNQKKSK